MNRHDQRAIRLVFALGVSLAAGCGISAGSGGARATNLVVPSQDGMRVVRTLLVVDPRSYPSAVEPLALVNAVSAEWQREFGIRFHVTETVRDQVPGANGPCQLDALIEKYPADEDRQLVVLFTGYSDDGFFELTEELGNHVLICPSRAEAAKPILHHGLGHIFGAPHSVLPGNYMTAWAAPLLWSRTASLTGFSAEARAAIASNKWRIFTLDEPLAQGEYVAKKPRAIDARDRTLAFRAR
jgi:hypothetical protein